MYAYDIYVYIYKEIYFRELAHAIMEAAKSQELQSATGNPGEPMVHLPVRKPAG